MTKHIRIENADTSDWKVTIEVWDEVEGVRILSKTVHLDNPTAMTTEYITGSRFITIKEFGPGSKERTKI